MPSSGRIKKETRDLEFHAEKSKIKITDFSSSIGFLFAPLLQTEMPKDTEKLGLLCFFEQVCRTAHADAACVVIYVGTAAVDS